MAQKKRPEIDISLEGVRFKAAATARSSLDIPLDGKKRCAGGGSAIRDDDFAFVNRHHAAVKRKERAKR